MLKKQSLLWSIESGDSNVVSYIYGTMHIGSVASYKFVDAIKPLILSKSQYYGETNLDELLSRQSINDFMLKDGQSLEDLIGVKRYKKYKRIAFKAYGANLDDLKYLIPFYISNQLSVSRISNDLMPLDTYLWEFAKANERNLSGLESVAFQKQILDNISIKYQLKLLHSAFRSLDTSKSKAVSMSKAYADQDIDKLYKMTKKQLGKLRKLLLYTRNDTMAESIVKNIEIPSFYTVGAAHLGGQKGILNSLKKEKISLTPINI